MKLEAWRISEGRKRSPTCFPRRFAIYTGPPLRCHRLAALKVFVLALLSTVAVDAAQAQPYPDLMLEKTGPDTTAADTDISYTVTVTNLGDAGNPGMTLTAPGWRLRALADYEIDTTGLAAASIPGQHDRTVLGAGG